MRSEDGSVLVMVALWLPVLILFASFVIDVGNWFEHKRHLQMQVDAAAFAGGGNFRSCFGGGGNGAVFDAASRYDGATSAQDYFPGYATAARAASANSQVGGDPDRVHLRYNNNYWYDQDLLDGIKDPFPLPDASLTGGPCASPYIFDVKATEARLPLFLPFALPFVPAINARARVQLFPALAGSPSLPFAPGDTNFSTTTVTFVNAGGNELSGCSGSGLVSGCTFQLSPDNGCLTADSLDVDCGSVTIPVAAGTNVRMRVGFGTPAGSCAGTTSTATYRCFDASDTGLGVYAIRGYPANGATAYGIDAWTCARNGSPFFSTIDPRTCAGGASIWLDDSIASTAKITATLGDGLAANKGVQLTRCTDGADPNCHDTARNAWLWSTTVGAFTLQTGRGVDTITFENGKKTLATYQFYSGGDAGFSGPIQLVQVTQGVNRVTSLPAGSNTFTVNVGYSNYMVSTVCPDGGSGAGYSCGTDPTVVLRSKLPNSNLTMAFDCRSDNANLRDQIGNGCTNLYQLHAGPPYTPTCTGVDPPDCATVGSVGSGTSTGQISQGMNSRWADSCNNYPNYADDDPRLIVVILTDWNAWNGGTGSNVTVPVVRFAAFYVTGWDGASGGCTSTNEPFPESGSSSQLGDVWGHFVKYVEGYDWTPNLDEVCDPASPTPCVPVLTK